MLQYFRPVTDTLRFPGCYLCCSSIILAPTGETERHKEEIRVWKENTVCLCRNPTVKEAIDLYFSILLITVTVKSAKA